MMCTCFFSRTLKTCATAYNMKKNLQTKVNSLRGVTKLAGLQT
jgi:hypothetical protein